MNAFAPTGSNRWILIRLMLCSLHARGYSFEDIGKHCDLSRERIRQMSKEGDALSMDYQGLSEWVE
jgi:hypothetical protein